MTSQWGHWLPAQRNSHTQPLQIKGGEGGDYLQQLGALSGITHLGGVDVHHIGLTWERSGDHDHHAEITTLHSGRSLPAYPDPLPKFKFPRAT